MIVRALAAGATLLIASVSIAVPAAASANPETWSWGSIYSADRAGKAKGKVLLDRPGFVVSGKLYDFPGRTGCSWLQFRWVKDGGGKGHKTYRNCSGTKPLAFSLKTGYMLSIEGKVCRGTARKITGKCSVWEGVWSQGG
ncbi:MAG: hypothetical protein HOV96_01835 [Nonomuraea sp.]|nr:hypothetical protein [Nonomuraea sp.]NUP67437.1 hypothetical protein [Nonomuraea sp.]NUP76274.1 hypothetical protein [Nonomuraea sp.]NUT10343.1 hypothetical protein [Nonomuraea sp.]